MRLERKTAIITGAAITTSTLKSNAAPFAVSDIRPGGTCGPTSLIQSTSTTTDSTAQVHPGLFTAAMMRMAHDRGAGLRLGKVTGVVRTAGRVRGVEIDGEIIAADAIVIAMGPW